MCRGRELSERQEVMDGDCMDIRFPIEGKLGYYTAE